MKSLVQVRNLPCPKELPSIFSFLQGEGVYLALPDTKTNLGLKIG